MLKFPKSRKNLTIHLYEAKKISNYLNSKRYLLKQVVVKFSRCPRQRNNIKNN